MGHINSLWADIINDTIEQSKAKQIHLYTLGLYSTTVSDWSLFICQIRHLAALLLIKMI